MSHALPAAVSNNNHFIFWHVNVGDKSFSTGAGADTDLLPKHFQVGVNNLTGILDQNRNETILACGKYDENGRQDKQSDQSGE